VVLEVRGDLQALDLEEVERLLSFGDVFFEGNPFVGELLCTHPRLADLPRLSVFVSPLSRAEISELRNPDRHVNLEALVTDLMRRKLLRRTRRQKGELALSDLEDIRRRAGSAYRELRTACRFDHVLCNHDGEDSDHWDAFYYPLGDARRVLLAFADLLQGNVPAEVEQWETDLIP